MRRFDFQGCDLTVLGYLLGSACLIVVYVELLHFLSSAVTYWLLPYWLNASLVLHDAFLIQPSTFLDLSSSFLSDILTTEEEGKEINTFQCTCTK